MATKAALTILAAMAAAALAFGLADGSSSRASSMPPINRIAHRVEQLRGLRFHSIPKAQLVSERVLAKKLSAGGRSHSPVARREERQALAGAGIAALSGILRPQDLDRAKSGGGSADVGGVYVPQTRR